MAEFSSLGELFRIQVELSKRHAKKITVNEDCVIPVCQHNIYRLAPYHVHLIEDKVYELWVPIERMRFITELDVPKDSFDSNFTSLSEEMRATCQWKTPEDRDSEELVKVQFRESEGFNLEDLGMQLYLSYANSFNYEMWYNALQNIKLKDGTTGEEYLIANESYLVSLKPEEIKLLYDLHLKTDRGKYIGEAYAELLVMKKSLQERINSSVMKLLSSYEAKSEGAGEGVFYFKLNTRSAKDSTFYKESGILAAIRKDSQDTALKKCQARNAFDLLCAIVASKRAAEDCRSYIHWKVKEGFKPPLQLVLQRYVRCSSFLGLF